MNREDYRPNWNEYKRGDVIIVNLGKSKDDGKIELTGIRPCVIISNDIGNRVAPIVTVAVMKTSKHDLPTHVFVKAKDHLKQDSYIMCENLKTIDKKNIYALKTKLKDYELLAMNEALMIAQGLK